MVYFSCLHPKIYGFVGTISKTCRTKTIRTPQSLLEETNFLDHGCLTPLENKLSDAITFLHLKVFVSMIEENDFDFTCVVRIYNTCAYIDTMLHGEA